MTEDNDVVLIKASHDGGTGLTEHKRAGDAIVRNFDDLRSEWDALIGKITELADSADERDSDSGLRLSELTVELGFTAAGKLAFIAEAGASASISLTFSRE